MAQPRAFNPNLFTLDDGRTFDTRRVLSMSTLGAEQEDQRRDALDRADWASGQTLYRSPRTVGYGNPAMAGYFGVLQGKENAAQAQGKNFDVDWTGRKGAAWGGGAPGMSYALNALSRSARNVGGQPASRGFGGQIPGAEDRDTADAQNHWLFQAMLRDQTDRSTDAAFADDPYRNRQLAENDAERGAILGRARFDLEREQNLPRVRMGIDAAREGLAAQRIYPELGAERNRQFQERSELESIKGLYDFIGKAYGKDPEAADEMFGVRESPVFQRIFGGGRPRAASPVDAINTLDGVEDLGQPGVMGRDIDLGAAFQSGAGAELVDRGGPVGRDDLVDRIGQELRARGIEPNEANIARVYENRLRRLGGSNFAPMASH